MNVSLLLSNASKPLVRRFTFDLVQQRNGHTGLLDSVRDLAGSEYLNTDELHRIQIAKLKHILMYAYENTHFYRKRFDAAGFDPRKFRTSDDLLKIPTLTKRDIRNHKDELMSSVYKSKGECIPSLSGGTTGPGIELYNSRNSLTQKLAAQLRFDSWAGWKVGDWTSIIWPAVTDLKHEPPTRRSRIGNYLSARSLALQQAVIEEYDFEAHFAQFKYKSPKIIRGFSFQVTEAAKYCLKNGQRFPDLKGVITTGEPLLANQRAVIQKAFDCPVFNSYRTREVGCIAQECEEHNGMHISAELLYVEIDHSSEQSWPSGEGKIVVTDLVNDSMPFIRYEIGDLGMLSDRICSCGRGLPLLESISGRVSDTLFTPNGQMVAPVTVIPSMFLFIGILNQFRIIQDRLDHLTIQMVKPAPDNDKLLKQREAVDRIFGEEMKISHEYVDRILPVASGKYPFVVSKLNAPAEH